jgi:hypothetical protein
MEKSISEGLIYFTQKNIDLSKFKAFFPDSDSCLNLLAECKWKNGFVCKKCGNTNYCAGKYPHSRRCTRCKTEETATAHTLFHHCKIPLEKAFEMAFTVCNISDVSSYKLSRQTEIRHMTCYQFQKKVMACKEKGDKDALLEEILAEVNNRINVPAGQECEKRP